jgi:hypothetical protein
MWWGKSLSHRYFDLGDGTKGQMGQSCDSHPPAQILEEVSNSDNQDSEPTWINMQFSLTYFLPSL